MSNRIFGYGRVSSKDQNEAAIITPAPKPNINDIIFSFTFLNKKTLRAPNEVNIYVNNVAKKANIT